MMLKIKDLHISVEGKEIVKGVTFALKPGQIIAIMGPNGSGKSTLANALMGNPNYSIDKGVIEIDRKDATSLPPDERAKLGLFMSFQAPTEISGISVSNFLRLAVTEIKGKKIAVPDFIRLLNKKAAVLGAQELTKRHLNDGFSGGEKKRCEILQLLMLEPKYAILDETDSGLDVDALRLVAGCVKKMVKKGMGAIIVTHYQKLLEHITPDKVYIMRNGKFVKEGGKNLAMEIERKGYG